MRAVCAHLKQKGAGEACMAGQGGRVDRAQTNNQRARCDWLFGGTRGRTAPNHPGVAKARGSREKTGRGNGQGGRGNRGPGPRRGAITSRRSEVPATHRTRDRWRNLRVLTEPVPATHQPQGTYRKTASPECSRLARSPPGRPPPTRGRAQPQTRDGMHPHSTNS